MATMQVELVSPERVLFSGEAKQVITRTLDGEIAFLPGHAPFLGALSECHTRITLADDTVLDVAVHGGFVQVSGNTVSILSDVAELGDEIDRDQRQQQKYVSALAPDVKHGAARDENRCSHPAQIIGAEENRQKDENKNNRTEEHGGFRPAAQCVPSG